MVEGYSVTDKGPYEYNPEDDYPDFISKTAEEVSKNPEAKGIVLGYSGEGEAMVANKFKGIRATAYYGNNTQILLLSREHNDANILALGAHFLTEHDAKEAVLLWLHTDFSAAERHIRRVEKVKALEEKK